MHEEYKLDALTVLKSARNLANEFILQQVDSEFKRIIKAMRKSPGKGGSLNIQIKIAPTSSDAEMIAFDVEVKNIKIPAVQTKPIMAYTTKDGLASINNPAQVEMFGDAKHVDIDTGEIIPVSSVSKKITPIK